MLFRSSPPPSAPGIDRSAEKTDLNRRGPKKKEE
jgi:hypothetical protein